MAKLKRVNWQAIEKEYVEGIVVDGVRKYPSQPDLCERYGLSTGTVGKKASADQWRVKREIFASKLREAVQEKTIETISDEASNFDLLCFNTAADAIRVLSEKVENASRGSDIDDLNKLSGALKNFQAVARVALGLPTDISKTSGSLSVTAKDLTRMEEDG